MTRPISAFPVQHAQVFPFGAFVVGTPVKTDRADATTNVPIWQVHVADWTTTPHPALSVEIAAEHMPPLPEGADVEFLGLTMQPLLRESAGIRWTEFVYRAQDAVAKACGGDTQPLPALPLLTGDDLPGETTA